MINGWRKRLDNNGGGVMSRNRGVEAGAEDALRSTSWPGVGGRGLVLTFISVNPPTARPAWGHVQGLQSRGDEQPQS